MSARSRNDSKQNAMLVRWRGGRSGNIFERHLAPQPYNSSVPVNGLVISVLLIISPLCPRSPFRSREPRVSKFPSGTARARKVSTKIPPLSLSSSSSPSPSSSSSSLSFGRVNATGIREVFFATAVIYPSGSKCSRDGKTGAAPVVAVVAVVASLELGLGRDSDTPRD